MAVIRQGKKSIWEEFLKFCKDDDIPGETLSKETFFRVEEPFNDPVPPFLKCRISLADVILKHHKTTISPKPIEELMEIGYPKKLMNDPMPLTMIWMSTNLRRLFRMMSGLASSQSCVTAMGKRLPVYQWLFPFKLQSEGNAKGKTFSRESELRDDFRRC